MTPPAAVLIAVVPLVIWRLYARIRRHVGRQESKLARHVAVVVFFPAAILVAGISAIRAPATLASLAGGVAVGVALGYWGVRSTQFEATSEGFFYTPNAHIGIGLSLLLVARLLYRFFEVYGGGALSLGAANDIGRSPLTLLIFGTLAAYYATYSIGILRWRRAERSIATSRANDA